ncbi:MAG: hypothetical protein JWN48_4104 [Myxococcaceae bacterium]|nr:hypothetical protein [Myxococcaceae bacterium]
MRFFVPLVCAGSALFLALGALRTAKVQAEPLPSTPPGEAPAASAPASTPELTELAARIQALERIEPLDDSVQRAVDLARAALERAQASRVAHDADAEARTRQLARAAVELAEARLRMLRERALFVAVQARRQVAAAELAAARQALAKERARALELQRESAAP